MIVRRSILFPISLLCLLLLGLVLVGCQHGPFFTDTGMSAADGNDKTLILSACESSLGRGIDICRFVEGSEIKSKLAVVLPWNTDTAISGTVRIRYKDTLRMVMVKDAVLELDWRDILGSHVWKEEHDGPVQISATLKFHNFNHEQTIKVLGYVYLIVLKQGYSPLPLYPKTPYSRNTCEINYNEQGSSSLICR